MNWPERNWIMVDGKLIEMGGPCFRFRFIDGQIVLVFAVPGKPDMILKEPDQWWR